MFRGGRSSCSVVSDTAAGGSSEVEEEKPVDSGAVDGAGVRNAVDAGLSEHGEGPVGDGSDADAVNRSEVKQERMYTQSEVDGILSRRLAKAKRSEADAEALRQQADAKYREGLEKGKVEAKREALADKYHMKPEDLPANSEALEHLEQQVDAYVKSNMRSVVVPTNDAKRKPRPISFLADVK